MNKKISRSIVFLAFTFISSLVFADGPLTIQTVGCEVFDPTIIIR